MKALTIRQPYTWAIIEQYKTFEFRSWQPPDDVDDFIVHASVKPDRAAYKRMRAFFARGDYPMDIPALDALDYGVGLGIAHIRALQNPGSFDDEPYPDYQRAMGYESHLWIWEIEIIKRFPEPIPARGQLGLWTWTDKAVTA